MKRNNFKILALLILAAFSSCSSNDSGDSNGTTSGDYFPMAVNNKWDYTNGSTVTEVNLIGTTTFEGATYYEMTDTQSPFNNQNWVAKKGASYYGRTGAVTQVQSGTSITIQPYELKILKDDLAVGETWSGTANPKVNYSGAAGTGSFNAHITYTGTVTARDVSEIIESVTYNNIIKVALTAVINANGQISNITGEYWYAKDIGEIYEHETSTADGSDTTRYLTSYTLH
ncbi:MAG: hypothetical protein ABIQ27_08750 [Flavobacterium sp.]|uniref:hypothetical protein n=1 Tax=Flavobacterium sp. TaxID=239 RepID=UPI0032670C29